MAAPAAPSTDPDPPPAAADSRSDAGAYRAADNRTDGTRRASALAYAFPAALLRAAENALGVAGVRNSQQRQRRGRHREINLKGSAGPQRRCLRLHLHSFIEPERRAVNAVAAKRLRERRIWPRACLVSAVWRVSDPSTKPLEPNPPFVHY